MDDVVPWTTSWRGRRRSVGAMKGDKSQLKMTGSAIRNTWPEQALLKRVMRDDAVHVASLNPAGELQFEDGAGQKPLF